MLLAFFAGALVFSGIRIGGYFIESNADVNALNAIRQTYAQALTGQATQTDGASENADDAVPADDAAAASAYAALTQINEDATGWIKIPGTNIDHPVVQCDDNAYYLNHSFEGQRSAHGCVFMDYRCHSDIRHIVVYGHHMKDGTMFGLLPQFELESYYQTHSTITLNLWGRLSQWQIFSVNSTDDSLMPVEFADDKAFDDFIQGLKNVSLYDTGIDVTSNDTVLTLSTCDGSSRERFVVHAKRIS